MERKMRVFLIGDYRTGTGPANVTLAYKNRIGDVCVQRMRSKILRVPELLLKTMRADVILISGHSRQNVLGLKLAHMFHKKAAFLMHGCVEHENGINGVPDEGMTKTERETIRLADAIYAVSSHFADWLRSQYPEYAGKISAVPNGIDLTGKEDMLGCAPREAHRLISIGGGMPRKRIRYIAEAVMILKRDPEFADAELIVIGDQGNDTEVINAYPCVRNLGLVSHERTMELLGSSALFVQNSCFETFGLAPLEALHMGTSLLLSREVGALEVFSHVEDDDLIDHTEDAAEIAGKIGKLLRNGNHDRLLSSIDTESVSWNKRCELLMKKLQELTRA